MTEDEIYQKLSNPKRDAKGWFYVKLPGKSLDDLVLTRAIMRASSDHNNQLQSLSLSNTRMTDKILPSLIEHYPRLLSLGLWNTKVTDKGVEALARNYPQLQSLDLRDTKVTDAGILALANHCRQLHTIQLRGTKVTDAGVVALANHCLQLQSINLMNTKVTDAGVQALAEHYPQLQSIDLSYTNVTDAGVQALAKHCPQLESVDFDSRPVTDAGLQALAKSCHQLQSIDLDDTNVTDVGVQELAEHCPQLQFIYLRCTKVTDTGVRALAEHCPLLQSLFIGETRVTDTGVWAVAKRCLQLQSLDLSATAVTDIGLRAVVKSLERLKYLHLYSAESLQIPQELIDSHTSIQPIREFYARSEKDGRLQLNEAKVIVVGNESVGKSALVEFLVHHRPCHDSSKTEGVRIHNRINVDKWDTEATPEEASLRLNVWDFGGQEVLYETHKLFLTNRSLYLLVLEARRENTDDGEAVLHSWMRAVLHRGGEEVPVIVVVNKAEKPHELRLDETRLMKEYPAIRAFIRTSCQDPKKHPEGGKGIVELRQKIMDVVRKDIPHARDWFPVSYFNVKEEVGQRAKESFTLTAGQYATICAKETITADQEQENVLTLLDRIGVVVRHRDTTLLDPNWLTTAIYRVLTHAEVVKANGEFAEADLGKLLQDLPEADRKYPQERWKYIVDQTEKCGLSFALPNQPGRYLMPEQLPPNEPDLRWWDEQPGLRFRYDYDNLPRGLLSRFIVEMHRHLETNRTAWANGVVLAVEKCRVLVRADRKNRRILVFVTGPEAERRGALAVIREGFARVHALFEELKPKPMVPVDVPGEPDAAVGYDHLIEFERKGLSQTTLPKAEGVFHVKELLDGVGLEPMSPRAKDLRDLLDERDLKRDRPRASEPLPKKPETKPNPGWHLLIGPGVAAIVAVVLAALWLYQPGATLTWLVTAGVVVFAVVYIIQIRHAYATAHWPKIQIGVCLAGAIVSAALPSLTLVFENQWLGKFRGVLDNSPWFAIVLVLAAVAFGVIQVIHDRDGRHLP